MAKENPGWGYDRNRERIRLAVSFAAMKDTANLDGVGRGAEEEEPEVADAKSEFFHSLECLYVALPRICEAMQGNENAHGGGLVQAADIGLSRFEITQAAHWSKDFVEHLRTVHLTLIATAAALVVVALTTKPYSTEVAKNELHKILELKANWSPGLFYSLLSDTESTNLSLVRD
jgi:hypothetical protein